MDQNLKVLVVDDTIVYRKIISSIVSDINGLELVGAVSNGRLALAKIKLSSPNIVLLDVAMPEMDGLETLKHIKKDYPDIVVVMISGANRENATNTVEALAAGAFHFIEKPKTISADTSLLELKKALLPIISMIKTQIYSHATGKHTKDTKLALKSGKSLIPKSKKLPLHKSEPRNIRSRVHKVSGKIDVIALAISTGGPNALHTLIPKLSKNLSVPILAVQHMPPIFTASLAERLDSLSSIKVVEGADGQLVEKGVMYIAPGGAHMVVKKGIAANHRLSIINSPPVNSCRPAADVLFRSIAMVYGGNVLSVIMTGMGNDGAAGVAALKRKGGYCIIQDKESSVVWGMPGSVEEAGDADEIIPLDQLADKINSKIK